MKKCTLIVVLASVILSGIAAQDRFPDLMAYFAAVMERDSPVYDFSRNSLTWSDPADNARFSNLTGNLQALDSYLEFALCLYFTAHSPAAERNRQAEKGNAILPLNNPRLVDRQLGAYVYKDMIIHRFLGDTAVADRHETMLQFITGRGNATRAEVEAFYRNGIRGLISAAVDEEFNKISFYLRDDDYNITLIRNPQTEQYILSYEGFFNGNRQTKTLSSQTLEALPSAMSRSGDFSQAGINTVRTQAALIPALALSDTALNEVKTILTEFYTTPNVTTYARVREVHIVLSNAFLSTRNVRYPGTYRAYLNMLFMLNENLSRRVSADVGASSNISTLTREQQQRLIQLR